MNQYINIRPFMRSVFDDEVSANKIAEIGQAILVTRSPDEWEIFAQRKINIQAQRRF